MYTLLRLRNRGEVSTYLTEDKKTAYLYYYTATLFNVREDSFLGLFHKEIMLINNQQGKHAIKRKNGRGGKKK
jgi:hypothetical protein